LLKALKKLSMKHQELIKMKIVKIIFIKSFVLSAHKLLKVILQILEEINSVSPTLKPVKNVKLAYNFSITIVGSNASDATSV
jgi:hypothetical protein